MKRETNVMCLYATEMPGDRHTSMRNIIYRTLLGDSAYVCVACAHLMRPASQCFFATEGEALFHSIACPVP